MHFRLQTIYRCAFLLLVCCACHHREERNVQRSFYYWKTVFNLSPTERQALTNLSVGKLYVKFFDVDWNEAAQSAQPIAKSIFSQPPPAGVAITPVVFITQEPLQHLSTAGLDSLATNTAALLSSIATGNHLLLTNEIQLDCDWTKTTRTAYFYFINQLKQQPFFKNKIVSATIRLHQAKFISEAGIPPVTKGLLMAYNMGNLRHPQTANSIVEEAELKKYIGNLGNYPLPLDVALPLFDWWILFEGDTYKGLVRSFTPTEDRKGRQHIDFRADTTINGIAFKKGQWLRHEESSEAVLKSCAALLSAGLKSKEVTVILYHLDSANLSKYSPDALQTLYAAFR